MSVQTPSCPSVLQWNINGLRGQLTQVRDKLRRRPYNVLLIQESKAEVADLKITGYTRLWSQEYFQKQWRQDNRIY